MIKHVYCVYGKFSDNVKRARNSWAYDDDFVNAPVHIDQLKRTSRDIGDSRTLPFIKDLLDYGFRDPKVSSVVLSNLDIGVAVGSRDLIKAGVDKFAFRRDFLKPIRVNISLDYLRRAGQKSKGVDLIHVSRDFFDKVKLPDLLMGYEGWDWVYRFALNTLHGGIDTDKGSIEDCIFHEYHGTPYWKVNRTKSVGNLWNQGQCAKWYSSLSGENKDKVRVQWPDVAKWPVPLTESKEVVRESKDVVPKVVDSKVNIDGQITVSKQASDSLIVEDGSNKA